MSGEMNSSYYVLGVLKYVNASERFVVTFYNKLFLWRSVIFMRILIIAI